jgi:hypothetical protein
MTSNPLFPPEVPFPDPVVPKRSEPSAMPVPIVYEEKEMEQMSLRTYAAIQLRVPDSGIDWLDQMILRSRELDRNR